MALCDGVGGVGVVRERVSVPQPTLSTACYCRHHPCRCTTVAQQRAPPPPQPQQQHSCSNTRQAVVDITRGGLAGCTSRLPPPHHTKNKRPRHGTTRNMQAMHPTTYPAPLFFAPAWRPARHLTIRCHCTCLASVTDTVTRHGEGVVSAKIDALTARLQRFTQHALITTHVRYAAGAVNGHSMPSAAALRVFCSTGIPGLRTAVSNLWKKSCQ